MLRYEIRRVRINTIILSLTLSALGWQHNMWTTQGECTCERSERRPWLRYAQSCQHDLEDPQRQAFYPIEKGTVLLGVTSQGGDVSPLSYLQYGFSATSRGITWILHSVKEFSTSDNSHLKTPTNCAGSSRSTSFNQTPKYSHII